MKYQYYSSLLHYLLIVLAVIKNVNGQNYFTSRPAIPNLQTTGFLPGIGTYLAYNNYVRDELTFR